MTNCHKDKTFNIEKKRKEKTMNKVEEYIKGIQESTGKEITSYKKALVYRCMLLELSEEQINLFINEDYSLQKEEYIIASILDGISEEFIKEQLLNEDDIEAIKQKRSDYLIDNFRANDIEYNRLKEELILLQTQAKEFDEKYNRLTKKIKELTTEIKEKEERIIKLDEIIEYNKEKAENERNQLHNERTVIEYKRPKSFKEKVRYIMGGELEPVKKTESTTNEITSLFDFILDPGFTIEQIKEIEKAYMDGLNEEIIKKIANKEYSVEKMYELRKFFCNLNGIKYTSSEKDFMTICHKADTENNNKDVMPVPSHNKQVMVDADGVIYNESEIVDEETDLSFAINEDI